VTQRLAGVGIDEAVRGVLLRALATDPLRRIASPGAFFAEMRAVLEAMPPTGAPPRRAFESITLIVEPLPERAQDAEPIAPAERIAFVDGRRVRIVDLTEKLDFTLTGPGDAGAARPIRFRIALLPSAGPEGFSMHVKGLNCFVVPGSSGGARARPTPAITASEGGEADLVSGEREPLVQIRWSFGRASDVGQGAGRAFDFGSGELVVPFSQASQAVAIDLGPEREAIVICRRA
jgi:hypothetical protein